MVGAGMEVKGLGCGWVGVTDGPLPSTDLKRWEL